MGPGWATLLSAALMWTGAGSACLGLVGVPKSQANLDELAGCCCDGGCWGGGGKYGCAGGG
eukprot:CAMPEP_0202912832 /NCGR_PEP_ID=MMETSP1392-20130828/58764_1 /ASSEMBLY_ACC=CAM_ASM_000868 /TAXON_ID=225041 /ORGANISM="Chlamydomonas chlamydogama, Strain SAG 11-48b" /LENGTH=60 /DNA_ID=CAMNT_0049603877 /DNA_START=272 /DNA_END=450 /DNA_ORIENTATION=-